MRIGSIAGVAIALAIFAAPAVGQQVDSSRIDAATTFFEAARQGQPPANVKLLITRNRVASDLPAFELKKILTLCEYDKLIEQPIFDPAPRPGQAPRPATKPDIYVTVDFNCQPSTYYSDTGTGGVFFYKDGKLSQFLFQVGGIHAPISVGRKNG